MAADPPESTVLMDAPMVANTVQRLAQEIVHTVDPLNDVALLGILTRGRPLADRIALRIKEMTGVDVPVGSVATTLYRDDVRAGKPMLLADGGETHFDFNVDNRNIILVDDVIAAGRTTRAALDEVMDYGRPARIWLACLVDRRVRELPIQPDFCGWVVPPEADALVRVRLREVDQEDAVLLEHIPPAPEGTTS